MSGAGVLILLAFTWYAIARNRARARQELEQSSRELAEAIDRMERDLELLRGSDEH